MKEEAMTINMRLPSDCKAVKKGTPNFEILSSICNFSSHTSILLLMQTAPLVDANANSIGSMNTQKSLRGLLLVSTRTSDPVKNEP
jgi:hypothetical protein